MAQNDGLDFTQRPWNMNANFLQQLDERRNQKAMAAISGDLWAWYRANIEIFTTIGPLMEPPEEMKMDKELKALHMLFQQQSMQDLYHQFDQTREMRQITQVEQKLREFDKKILAALYKHELVYIKPKKKTVEEYLQEDDYLD